MSRVLGALVNSMIWRLVALNSLPAGYWTLRSDDAPDYEQSPLETGNLAHRFLHDLIAGGPDFSDHASALASAHERMRAWRQREAINARDPAFFQIDWAKLERMVEEFIEYEFSRRRDGEAAPTEIKTEYPLQFYAFGRTSGVF